MTKMTNKFPVPGSLERSEEDRLFAAMPTAASLMAAIEMWDTFAPSHLRGLLRCQVADQPEAPPVARATTSVAAPYVSATPSLLPTHTGTFAQGLAQFGLAPVKRFQSERFVVFTYNPNEPRDSQGEWTAGGGAGDTVPRIRQTVPALEEISTWASRDYRDWARPGPDASGRVHDMTDKYQGWANNLTDDERTAITRYQSGARMYNGYLRHGDKPNKPMEEEMDLSTETDQPFTLDQAVGELQEATMTPAPVDIRAYRGGHVPKKLKSGDIVQDDAFVSTSLAINEASDFVHNAPNSDLIVVDVPKGSPAAYLDANMDAGEQELLLPHGSTFAYMGTIDTKSIETTVEGVELKKYAGQSWLPRKIKRFVYLGPMNKQPSMAHFKHELSDLDEPDDENAGKYEWQEGDLRVIGHAELRASFVFNPEEARDEAGKWTIGGPHVAVALPDRDRGAGASDSPQGPLSTLAGHPFTPEPEERTSKLFYGTPDEAEDEILKAGVQYAHLQGNKYAARVIVPVIRKMKKLGLPLPGTVASGTSDFMGTDTIAMYVPAADTFYFNRQHPYWQDSNAREEFMRKQMASGWFVSDDPTEIALHELGHCVAEKSGSQVYKYATGGWHGPGAKAQSVALEVSRYAATRPHEFVAETFAGLMLGKTYSAPVMVLYKAQGGVVPGATAKALLEEPVLVEGRDGVIRDVPAQPKHDFGPGYRKPTADGADPWESAVATVGKRAASGATPKYADLTKPRDMLHEPLPKTTPDGKEVPALPSDMSDLDSVTHYLQHDLGIRGVSFITDSYTPKGSADYKHAQQAAAYVAPIMQRMYAQGLPMPYGLYLAVQPDMPEDAVAWYDPADNSLNLNKLAPFWKSDDESRKTQASKQLRMHFWSTGGIEHPVVHEMGHLLARKYQEQVGQDQAQKSFDAALKPLNGTEALTDTCLEVSRYAATSPFEFQAEVFTGLYAGKTYPADVMALYKGVSGPPVSWRKGEAVADFSARFRPSGALVRIPMAMQVMEV